MERISHNVTEYDSGNADIQHQDYELNIFHYERSVRQLLNRQADGKFDWDMFYLHTGVRFSGENFLLAELEDDPDHPSGPPLDEREHTPGQRYEDLRGQILKVIGTEHPTVICNQGGRMVCVINWQGSEMNWQHHFTELMEQLNTTLLDKFHFCFQCTVSRMCVGVEKLPQLNKELEQARNYRKMLGGLPGEILFYDGILRTTGLENREAPEKQEERQRQLQLYLLQGDGEAAKEVVHTIIEDYFKNSRPAVQFVQLRYFEVIDLILKSLDRIASELGHQDDFRELQLAPRLLATENITDLEKTADVILDEFSAMIGENGIQARLPNRIRTYIREHYQNPNLNVNMVADVFDVTPTYATRVFKQEFQCGILSYIQKVRVDAAKKLLDSTHTIKEVSEKVGFSTPSALIRNFKKLEGMTPAQYSIQKQT